LVRRSTCCLYDCYDHCCDAFCSSFLRAASILSTAIAATHGNHNCPSLCLLLVRPLLPNILARNSSCCLAAFMTAMAKAATRFGDNFLLPLCFWLVRQLRPRTAKVISSCCLYGHYDKCCHACWPDLPPAAAANGSAIIGAHLGHVFFLVLVFQLRPMLPRPLVTTSSNSFYSYLRPLPPRTLVVISLLPRL